VNDQYISVDAAALELEVSRATAWKWIKRHELQTFRFMGDRKTYIRRDALARFREPIPVALQKKQAA
jgi:excisionase family DNA binding protein